MAADIKARFLNGIPPHRFDPHNKVRLKKQAHCCTCLLFPGGDDGDRALAPLTLCPSLASSVGQIPKNSSQGCFLNGISPHRFDPHCPAQIKSRYVSAPACYSLVEMMGIERSLRSRSAPPSQARSGEFLKTCHRHVFLTEFHLIGSIPTTR